VKVTETLQILRLAPSTENSYSGKKKKKRAKETFSFINPKAYAAAESGAIKGMNML